MSTESGLTVRVKKKKSVISFAIDMERTPYFFSDREKVVTSKGQTKKIFHIVRGHMPCWAQSQNSGSGAQTGKTPLGEFPWPGLVVELVVL